MKDEEIYNIFNTREILGREPGVTISKTSGLAGSAYWINQHYKLTGDDRLIGPSPKVIKLKD